ncbi:uncharacterized protein LOC142165223 [Nicotiana tabacum]|uniref:Uncharacterized protein LOC142165223 n=1 Tax=Nicotiana tabacum TaxID=4097 RepID=A0AC58S4M9_TOBAC
MAGNEVTSLDHNHPLHLQPGDSPGLNLIQLKLTGPNKYALWSRAMKLALRGKGKLGFVDGTCVKIMYKGELAEQWEKYNVIVLSWIGSTVAEELMASIVYASNAKKVWSEFEERFDRSNLTRIFHLWTEIPTLKQETESVTSYYSKMKNCWDELDVLTPLPSFDCKESLPYVVYLRSQRLLQFLMGLNKSTKESQRLLGVVDVNKDPLTMLAGRTYQSPKPKRAGVGIICEHCGYKGHLKENCY